jgi:hypothetical protein
MQTNNGDLGVDRIAELRNLREQQRKEWTQAVLKDKNYPFLAVMLTQDTYEDGSERFTSELKVTGSLGCYEATFIEHEEGWSLKVNCEHLEGLMAHVEHAVGDITWPRHPYKTYKKKRKVDDKKKKEDSQ